MQPLTYEHARAVVAGARDDDWAEGYPTAGDREIAALLMEGADADEQGTESTLCHRRIVERESRLVVGGIGFGGLDADGALDIGFGIAPGWRNRGLVTEAVGAMIQLACAEPHVHAVSADTEITNAASRRVLEKAGMLQQRVEGPAVFYRIDCSSAVR